MLLFGGWVSSFLVLDWMIARSQVAGSSIDLNLVADIQRRLHQPILRYERTDYPGAYSLTVARVWCAHHANGQDTSWKSVTQGADWSRSPQANLPATPPTGPSEPISD